MADFGVWLIWLRNLYLDNVPGMMLLWALIVVTVACVAGVMAYERYLTRKQDKEFARARLSEANDRVVADYYAEQMARHIVRRGPRESDEYDNPR